MDVSDVTTRDPLSRYDQLDTHLLIGNRKLALGFLVIVGVLL